MRPLRGNAPRQLSRWGVNRGPTGKLTCCGIAVLRGGSNSSRRLTQGLSVLDVRQILTGHAGTLNLLGAQTAAGEFNTLFMDAA
jgi:hypothetical protein